MDDIRIRLGALPDIRVRINAPPAIRIRIGDVIVVHYEEDIYVGPYEVTPDFDTQTLDTAQKTMTDDVTVEPIPVYRTSNPQGGKTIYIGGILDG